MRDIGALVWVAVVVLGVISSIVSSARKQNAARVQTYRPPPARPSAPRAPVPPNTPAVPTRPATPAAASPAPTLAFDAPGQQWGVMHLRDLPETHKQAPRMTRALFGNRSALVRAVAAAEVLGKPRALRDEA